jgi:translocation and assembly module TamB
MGSQHLPRILVAAALAASGATFAWAQQSQQDTLAGILSWALSTPENRVTVGAVEGALSSDAVIRDVRISDRNGTWLTVDRARLTWSYSALLSRRLEVDALEVDTLTISRRPVAEEAAAAQAAPAPALPELPVKVVGTKAELKQLVLGEPVVGTAARIAARGNTVLGNPSEGLSLNLVAERLDAQGQFSVALAYVPQAQRLDLRAALDEPGGGLLSRMAAIPGEPPVRLRLDGRGPLDDFAATLDFESGPEIGATGRVTVGRTQGPPAGRQVAMNLTARVAGLMPPAVAPVFAGATTLTGNVLVGDDGAVALRQVELAARTLHMTVGGGISADRTLDMALAMRAVPTDGDTTRAGVAQIARLALDATLRGPADAPVVTASLAAGGVATPEWKIDRVQGSFSAQPANGASSLTASLEAAGIVATDAAVNRAIGGRVTAGLRARLTGAVLDIDALSLDGPTARSTYSGRLSRSLIDGKIDASVPDLAAFSGLAGRPLGGRASVQATVQGNPARYSLTAQVDGRLDESRVGIAAVDRLLAGSVTAKGTMQRLPGGFGFSGFQVAGRHLTARLDGSATATAADLGATLDIPDLRRADERLTGRATGEARVTGSLERPNLSARIALTGASGLGRPIPRLEVRLDAKDILRDLAADIAVSGEVNRKPATGRARVVAAGGGYRLENADLAVGSVRLAGDVRMDRAGLATGRLALKATDLADIAPLALLPLSGDVDATIRLDAPAGGQNAAVEARAERMAAGEFAVRRLQANLTARDIRRAPALDGSASLDELTLAGQRFTAIRLSSRPEGAASAIRLTAKGLGQDITLAARVRPADGRLVVEAATLSSGKAVTLTASGSLPLQAAGALDIKAKGTADAALANAALLGAGQRVTGRLALDMVVAGTAAQPRVSGSATLTGGSFDDPLTGFRLQRVEGRFAARDETVTVERLTAATPNGGTLSGSGRITLDPAAGFPAELRLTGRNARLTETDVVSATADLDMQVSGPLARSPRIGGRVDITGMDVSIPGRLGGAAEPLPNTRHVKPGPAAAARLALARKQAQDRKGEVAFIAAFDLTVAARNRIFVRGRGLEAELGGSLRLGGTTAAPTASGAFNLRNGRIDIAGQRLDLVRGALTFTGDLVPSLDFLAETRAGDVTAQIAVSGPADKPDFTVTSRPELPQDEVLSRILFGRATGELTGFQALQLAQSVAQLTGAGGPGALDALRRSLGVDSLDVGSTGSGGPGVGLARRLGDRVRVGVKAGAKASDTGLGVDFDVTRHIKLRGQVGADGSSSAGVAAEWEY